MGCSCGVLCILHARNRLEFDLTIADVFEERGCDGHELRAGAEVQRVGYHIRIETFLLILQFLELECTWAKQMEFMLKTHHAHASR